MSNEHNKWQKVAEEENEKMEQEELLEPPQENPSLDFSSRDDLEKQLNELETKYNDTLSALRYTQAELDNFRKRSEMDISKAYKFGPEKLIKELLTIIDSFEKTLEMLEHDPNHSPALKEGIELTYKMLMSVLEKFSVKQVNPRGEVFNPTWHEAMTMQEKEGEKSGTVLTVLQKGYTLHDRLLRPALVVVAK